MNILLTVNFSPWSSYSGGGQYSTHYLATSLQERGHSVTVIYTKSLREKIVIPNTVTYTVKWAIFFGFSSKVNALLRPLNAVSVFFLAKQLLKKEKIDVIHSQGEEGALIKRLHKKYSFRFIVTPRYPSYPEAMYRKQTFIEWFLFHTTRAKYTVLHYAITGADQCTATSPSIRKEICAVFNLPENKVTVIPNGINSLFLKCAKHDFNKDGYILFFGRLTFNKGIDVFIETFSRFKNKKQRAVIIGRSDNKTDIPTLLTKYKCKDRVDLINWLSSDDLIQVARGASMAVLPSREESFGNAMIEALAMGLPLVTTSVGSLPEVIPENTSFLIPVNNSDLIVERMNWIIENYDQALKMARTAQEQIRKKYNWDNSAQLFEKIYRQTSNN
ncbi:MAG: glycosyltransferase family 4 protein [Spirochaetes bacterium]|jgi:glycosyltransferase involved in cell wall biosynthesis|nr:glycosyltransferase family 4 protein [Spirochaetota bacterium]